MINQFLSLNGARDRDADPLTQPIVRHGKRCNPTGILVTNSDVFDVRGINVMATPNDQILQTAFDAQIPLVVHDSEIARQEPSVAVEAAFGGSLLVEVAEHQRGTAPADMANLAGTDFPVGIIRIE
ncbi:Uncharacterised protein [Mycobacterium tuberculosis]|nr:Uncharacterised protein [Mycobacterium tuberculosis]